MKSINANQNESISHATFVELIRSNLVGQVSVCRTPKRFYIQLQLNNQTKIIASQRQKVKSFASLDSADKYLRSLGIRNYFVS